MTKEKSPSKPGKVPVIPIFVAAVLVATYIYLILIPAFSRAHGVPDDIVSLIAQPVLIVAGLVALIWGRSWFDKMTERK